MNVLVLQGAEALLNRPDVFVDILYLHEKIDEEKYSSIQVSAVLPTAIEFGHSRQFHLKKLFFDQCSL